MVVWVFWRCVIGAWRSLVSAPAWGAGGQKFESSRPDHFGMWPSLVRALGSGPRGRGFESHHPDQFKKIIGGKIGTGKCALI